MSLAQTPNQNQDALSSMELKFLSEDQNESFDQEYHWPREMKEKIVRIGARFPRGPETILDIGGGNGRFLDNMLDAFPNATGYLLDISPVLLSRNTPSARKHLLEGSISELAACFPTQRFDVITVNWVLHHLVGSEWERSVANVTSALEAATQLLSPGGVIVIAELMFNDIFGGDLPSHLTYAITCVKNPRFVKLARRYFNTAGVGVCFHSQSAWERIFERVGLKIEQNFFGGYRSWVLPFILLALKSQRDGHYFLSRR